MKKTLTANISGKVFNIEEDAFGVMSKYLESISLYFKNFNDKDEILVDFEQRISENLLSILSNQSDVVLNSHVYKIIEIMGKPQQHTQPEKLFLLILLLKVLFFVLFH